MPADTPARSKGETRGETRAVSRFVLVALVLPCLVVLAGVVALLIAMPAFPDPVAIHWGAAGTPDGFGPPWLPAPLLAGVGLGIAALLTFTALPSLRRGVRSPSYRLLGALSLGEALFLTILVTALTLPQAGLADAADAPLVGLPMALAIVGAVVGLVAGWFLQPHQDAAPVAVEHVDTLDLQPGERAAWLRTVTMARSGMIVLAVGILVLVGSIVLTWTATDEFAPRLITLIVTVGVAVAVVTNVAFRVRIDAAGLTATSVVGWPRLRVPLADVAEAAVVHVDPMGEFGGWGIRWAAGRTGVVLRAGEGILVRRRSRRDFVVTVDDAETGVALLTALSSREGS
ncbi:DUF1648 domain-containing protein [Microbacterium sp.]|uniref:DUF1648 domain-containing protein n=1 Tax=Microbacterium sp. TaxID=51671 RepID=UPI003C714831